MRILKSSLTWSLLMLITCFDVQSDEIEICKKALQIEIDREIRTQFSNEGHVDGLRDLKQRLVPTMDESQFQDFFNEGMILFQKSLLKGVLARIDTYYYRGDGFEKNIAIEWIPVLIDNFLKTDFDPTTSHFIESQARQLYIERLNDNEIERSQRKEWSKILAAEQKAFMDMVKRGVRALFEELLLPTISSAIENGHLLVLNTEGIDIWYDPQSLQKALLRLHPEVLAVGSRWREAEYSELTLKIQSLDQEIAAEELVIEKEIEKIKQVSDPTEVELSDLSVVDQTGIRTENHPSRIRNQMLIRRAVSWKKWIKVIIESQEYWFSPAAFLIENAAGRLLDIDFRLNDPLKTLDLQIVALKKKIRTLEQLKSLQ